MIKIVSMHIARVLVFLVWAYFFTNTIVVLAAWAVTGLSLTSRLVDISLRQPFWNEAALILPFWIFVWVMMDKLYKHLTKRIGNLSDERKPHVSVVGNIG